MKRTVLCMGVLATLLAACNSKSAQNDEENDVRELKLKTYSYEKKNAHTEAKIVCEFPVGGDEKLCDALYTYLVKMFKGDSTEDEVMPDFQNDGQAFVDYFGNKKWDDLQEGWDAYSQGDDSLEDVLDDYSTFKLLTENDHFITFRYEYDCYYGGDGYASRSGITFLKDEAIPLTNDYLLRKLSEPRVLELIRENIKEKYTQGELAFLEEEEIDYINKLPESPLYLTEEGVGFSYKQYEVHWSYLNGIIPLNKIKRSLTEEALELFEE